MPRPIKWRNVCGLPENERFGPIDAPESERKFITMTVDEYETIRLIDLEGFNQTQCAEQMNIARTTVQGIYTSARKKLAESLVNGSVLVIKGGEYVLTEGSGIGCMRGCKKCRKRKMMEKEHQEKEILNLEKNTNEEK